MASHNEVRGGRRKGKGKSVKAASTSAAVAPLVIPTNQVALIRSILSDLGRAAPKKRNRLNNVLKKLIEDGVILTDGSINHGHELIQMWLDKVDEKRKQGADCVSSANEKA